MKIESEEKGWAFYVITGLMEFSWAYSIALFATSWGPYGLPLLLCLFTFFLALIRGLRSWFHYKWQALLSHLFPLSAIMLYYLYRAMGSLDQLFSFQRLPLQEKAFFSLVALLLLALWWGGHFLSQRPTDFSTISSRFDLGCGAFFLLFLIEGMMDSSTLRDLPALALFFLSSLLAMPLSRKTIPLKSSIKRGWLTSLSLALILLLFASLTFLFLQPLEERAREGYTALKGLAEPLLPILVSILRFLFFGMGRSAAPTTQGVIEQGEGEALLLEEPPGALSPFILYSLYAIVALLLIALLGWLLYTVWQWLQSPLQREKRKRKWPIILYLQRLFYPFVRWLKTRRRPITTANIFASLLLWSRRWGLSLLLGETPREHSLRLGKRFPFLAQEIELIVDGYYREVFGQQPLKEEELAKQKKALLSIKSPFSWPKRALYSFRWYRRAKGMGS